MHVCDKLELREVLIMKVRNSIFSVCFMFLLIFGLGGCSSQDTGTTNNDVTTQNGKLIYEETISPNKEYVENEEDVVNYTVEIYQDENNKILVSSKSNSGLYEPAQYELDFNTSITESDVDVEWTTLMGESTPTENDQLSIAYVSISENGKDTIKIKISFVNGGIEIIEDALEKK